MGQLTHDPHINHFSHPHPLELANSQTQYVPPCTGCDIPATGWMYSCKQCNFNLHSSCSQMPTLITHPAHHIHPLTLLPVPPYSGGSFNCDACGQQGTGFSYHCAHCFYDIHITCATSPLTLINQYHPHELSLTFQPPYHTNGFACDLCGKVGHRHWLYRCGPCEFDAHLECATGAVSVVTTTQPQPQLQHYGSFPAPIQHQQQPHYMHSQSVGARQVNYSQVGNPVVTPRQSIYEQQAGAQNAAGNSVKDTMVQGFVDGAAHSQSVGARQVNYSQVGNPVVTPRQSIYEQQARAQNAAGNSVKDTMVQGFVDGAAQQVGQSFVQSIMGGNGDNNSGNDGGGGGASPSIISIGSSILSGVFGGDST